MEEELESFIRVRKERVAADKAHLQDHHLDQPGLQDPLHHLDQPGLQDPLHHLDQPGLQDPLHHLDQPGLQDPLHHLDPPGLQDPLHHLDQPGLQDSLHHLDQPGLQDPLHHLDQPGLQDPPYLELQKPDSTRPPGPPAKAQQRCIMGLPLGIEYEKKKQKLQQELRMDYRRYVAQSTRGQQNEDDERKPGARYGMDVTVGTSRTRNAAARRFQPESEFITGLLIGAADSDEALLRRKERYRRELQEQIAEQHRNRKREKDLELKVALSGAIDPEKKPDRIRSFRPPQADRTREPPDPLPSPLLEYSAALGLCTSPPLCSRFPVLPPDAHLDPNKSNRRVLSPSIPKLFDPHADKYTGHYWNPPPGGAVTALPPPGGAVTALPPPGGAVTALPPPGGAVTALPPPGGAVTALPPPGGAVTALPPPGGAVTALPPPGGAVTALHGGLSVPESVVYRLSNNDPAVSSDEKSKSEQDQVLTYREALRQQIMERQERRREERERRELYEARLEEEMLQHEPWGRGGGGAPLRDSTGNLLADLNQMHKLNEEAYINPGMRHKRTSRPRDWNHDNSDRLPGFTHVQTSRFGRGNLLVQQPCEQQLREQERYKAFLRQQIEEKLRKKAEEREQSRLEEEKEEKRLAEQRARIQREYEEEQERKKRKELEQRMKNEELMHLAEQRRKEAERKKKEEEEKENAKQRLYEREKQQEEEVCREPSPPIPTLQKPQQASLRSADRRPATRSITPPTLDPDRRPTNRNPRTPPMGPKLRPVCSRSPSESCGPSSRGSHVGSPPVPARRNQLRAAAAQQQEVFSELSALRQQLRSEQKRLQEDWEDWEDWEELDAWQRPPVDVFDMARLRLTAPVRRPTPRNVEPRNLERIHQSLQLQEYDSERPISMQSLLASESSFMDPLVDAVPPPSARQRRRQRQGAALATDGRADWSSWQHRRAAAQV